MWKLLIAAFAVLAFIAANASTGLAQSDKGRYVRVFTEFTKDKDSDPLSFDLIINDKKRAMTDGYMYGLLGLADQGSDCRSFVFLEDGSMDFGGEDDRWWKSDLRERTIEPNGTLKVWDANDEEFEYKIVKIVDLPAKLPYSCE
jgi:hypothetical protein